MNGIVECKSKCKYKTEQRSFTIYLKGGMFEVLYIVAKYSEENNIIIIINTQFPFFQVIEDSRDIDETVSLE